MASSGLQVSLLLSKDDPSMTFTPLCNMTSRWALMRSQQHGPLV